ncbi:unnamed protein product, partial [Adineta steineri]
VGNMYNTLLNVTEDQCICEMIKVNDSISALNYFSTNQTCQLFRSNMSTIFVEFYLNSTIIFLNQSSISILNILEYQPSTPSSTPTAISSTSPSASPSSTSSPTSSTTSKTTSTSTTTSSTTSSSPTTSKTTSTSTTTSSSSSSSTTTSTSTSTTTTSSTTTGECWIKYQVLTSVVKKRNSITSFKNSVLDASNHPKSE